MGVAERKERHREELKKDILEAAKSLFVEKGYEATSIRNIAEKIEYSPATIYLYYKDKNAIIHALHQEGFKLLVEHFKDIAIAERAFDRLIAMGHAYIQFALKNPDMYNLIFNMVEPMEHLDTCENWEEGDRAFDLLLTNVKDCQAQGYFWNMDAHSLALMIWSTMHGMCTLRITGHLGHVAEARNGETDIDAMLSSAFESFVQILKQMKN